MAPKTKSEEQAAASADVAASAVGAEPLVEGGTAAVAQTRVRVQQGMERAMRTAEEVVAFGQGNVAALVRSGQIWAAGLQDLGKQVAATAQEQIADTMNAFKAIAGAKSVRDAIEAQAVLARNTIEKTVAESGRITETSLKLTEQAMAPVAARVSLAVEKFGRAA